MLEKIRQIFSRMKDRLSSKKKKEEQELNWETESSDLPEQNDPTLTQKLNNLIAKLKSVKQSDLMDPFVEFEEQNRKSKKGFSLKNIDYAELLNFLSSPEFYTRFHRYFLIAFLILSIYTTGKLTALILRGQVPSSIHLAELKVDIDKSKELTTSQVATLKRVNPFKTGSAEQADKKAIAKQQKCDDSDDKTDLPITLKNTIVLQDSVKSMASIQVRSKISDFRQGEELGNMAKLERIERLRIIIKNLKTGACEFAENKDSKSRNNINVLSKSASRNYLKSKRTQKGIKNEGNRFTIDKSLIQEKMKDISSILTQAKATPFKNPDGTMSFKLDQVQPGGIFATLGVQNGDTITKINGKSIESVNEVMGLFGKLQQPDNIPNINLTIKRDGSEEILDYNFK